MAYRVAPLPSKPFVTVREIAAVASEIADAVLIHRGEAQHVVDACRERVVALQGSELNARQLATLDEARERGFVLEILDGCSIDGVADSLRIIVMPQAALYATFLSGTHEEHHMPMLQKLARRLGYEIQTVPTDFYLEAQVMAGRSPTAEA